MQSLSSSRFRISLPVALWVLLSMLMGSPLVGATQHIDVIKLRAADFPFLVGKEISTLRMAVGGKDALEPIPFQIDKMDEFGMPWFAETETRLFGDARHVAAEDEILLMYSDLAPESPAQLAAAQAAGAVWLGTLQIGGRGGSGVYVFAGGMPLSERHYVSHNIKTGVTETDDYILRVDPDNELNWQYLAHKKFGDGDSVIDTLKMQMRGGAFTRWPKITLDNDNLKPKIVGHIQGPIRSVLLVETTVVVAKIPVMRMFMQAHRYPSHFEAHSFARIPAIFRKAMVEPEVFVGLDGNNLMGSTIITASNPNYSVKVDGKWDDNDQKLVDQGLTMENNWLLFDTGRNMKMLVFFTVPDYMQHLPLKLAYIDDARMKMEPENQRGQTPFLGYGMEGMPDVDLLRFAMSIRFYAADADLSPVDVVRQTRGERH